MYLHIRCQLLHVLAPRCHLQGVYQQQRILSPTCISGTSCPHLQIAALVVQSFSFVFLQLPVGHLKVLRYTYPAFQVLVALPFTRMASAWNMCCIYNPLFLINSPKMALWCWNKYKLVPIMKCILWSVLLYLN